MSNEPASKSVEEAVKQAAAIVDRRIEDKALTEALEQIDYYSLHKWHPYIATAVAAAKQSIELRAEIDRNKKSHCAVTHILTEDRDKWRAMAEELATLVGMAQSFILDKLPALHQENRKALARYNAMKEGK